MVVEKFTGVFTALVTPFKSGEVDYSSLKRLLAYQMDRGVHGFVVNGTTGESPTLSWDEVKSIFQFCKTEVAGQVPLVLGTGSNSTASTLAHSKEGADWGADALLVVTPYYNKPSQRGLLEHFKVVADNAGAPLLLYNIPSRSVIKIEDQTLRKLAEHPNIIGVKDATGDISFGVETISANSGFLVSSGDDLSCMELMFKGGHGVISVISHLIPQEIVNLSQRARAQDTTALEEADKLKDLMNAIYLDSNPVPVKHALFRMGVIDSDEVRLPLFKMGDDLKEKLVHQLKLAGLL